MIFQPDAIALIKERRKSQTRRDWPVCRVRVGHKYAVQPGRGQRGVLEITILDVRRERLGDISQRDVRAEGFQFRAEFEQRWRELHGRWMPDFVVWVVTFAVGDLRDRFDRPRLLKATPGVAGDDVDPHQDYTSIAALSAQGEPEGVDARSLDRFAAEGLAGHAKRKADEFRTKHVRTLTVRLRDAERCEDWDAYREVVTQLARVELTARERGEVKALEAA